MARELLQPLTRIFKEGTETNPFLNSYCQLSLRLRITFDKDNRDLMTII